MEPPTQTTLTRLEAPRAAPSERLSAQTPESNPAVRLLVFIIAGITLANLISAAIAISGLPLSNGLSLIIHSALTVGVLFVGLYLFSIGPLLMELREVRQRRDEILQSKQQLERQLAQLTTDLGTVKARLTFETDGRAQAEEESRRLARELEERILERTSKFEAANRDLQAQLAEQRRASDALLESEKRYRRLVEIAKDGVWTINAQGKTNFINGRGAELLGFRAQELLGRAPADFVLIEDLPREIQGFDLLRGRVNGPLEFRMRRKDAREIWVRASVTAIMGDSGDYLGALVIFSDITARRRSEQRLQEQAALLDLAQDAFVLCDSNLHVLSWSQGAARLYGWVADEALGKDAFELLADKSAPVRRDEILLALGERGAWRGELQHVTKDKRQLTVDARLNITAASPGRASSVLLVATDITFRKKRESIWLRDQRIESAGALASGLAQELNTNLTTILLSAQMLRARRLEREDQDLVAAIEGSAGHGADLLRQALTFARGLEGERVPIPPRLLFNEMTDIAREMFPRNIQVLAEVEDAVWNIKGDATQLHQALLKLCVHARDSMPAGGILRLKARNKPLDETAVSFKAGMKPGPYVLIEIQDSGASLSGTELDRIFEPYSNGKETHKVQGLGGLALVLGLVKSHGGSIEVRSQMGTGTTFEILLPAITESLTENVRPAPEPAAGRGELILMVEDDPGLRDVVQRALKRYGYDVLAASDGMGALGLLTQHQGRVRVLFTNLITPTMDGPALARAARKIDPRVRIIASSSLGKSLGQAEKLAALQSLGISRILAKPYTTEELLRAVRDELG